MKMQKMMPVPAAIIVALTLLSLMTVPAHASMEIFTEGCTLRGPAKLSYHIGCKYFKIDVAPCLQLKGNDLVKTCEWGCITILKGTIQEGNNPLLCFEPVDIGCLKGRSILILVIGDLVIALLPLPWLIYFGKAILIPA